jgi:DNA-directed RNA polymerase
MEDLEDDEHKVALAQWYKFMDAHGKGGLPRKIPKRPVMTLPYGATRQSCTRYIFEGIIGIEGNDKSKWVIKVGRFKASTFLTPYLWASIGEVVVAARVAMDWLQSCAGIVAKEGPLYWFTPDGFPVYQAIYKTEDIRVRTQLAGDLRLKISQYTDEICPRGMRSSVSPNFVHSMDAAHLRETVRRCEELGITDLACIHDDYGTHACDTDTLHSVIREAFIHLYSTHDPLQEFSDQQVDMGHKMPSMPPKGTLDIEQVRHSKYFFG